MARAPLGARAFGNHTESGEMMYSFIFVDDEDLMREFFRDVVNFGEYGFKLAGLFSSAEQALPWLKEHPETKAVITDIQMGTLSGLDFCEKIREYNQDILLIVLSGYKEFEYARRALRCDVFDYLLKPTMYEDIDMLFKRMKKHLDAREKGSTETDCCSDYRFESMICKIKNYIEDNYNKDITLDLVARHVCMNPSYLSRFFKQHTGSNFLDYVSQVRVNKAIGYLADPMVRVCDICDLVGYKSPQHFYKIFKQYTGCTPSEYRLKASERAEDGGKNTIS